MLTNFAILDLNAPELIIILGIVLLLFGGKKLPELSRSLGQSIKEIKSATSSASDLSKDLKSQANDLKASVSGNEPRQ